MNSTHCPFCRSLNAAPSFYLPGNDGVEKMVYTCGVCFVHYCCLESCASIKSQVKLHSQMWMGIGAEEARDLKSDLIQMVINLRRVLGDPESNGLVLELGAGRGALTAALISQGYNAIGTEPSRELVKLARENYGLSGKNLRVQSSMTALNYINKINGCARIIIAWHVLEHLKHPMPTIEKALSLLNTNGRLIAQVPLLQDRYIFPEHYFFMTPQTVSFLSNKYGMYAEYNIDYKNAYMTFVLCRNKNDDSALLPNGVRMEECESLSKMRMMAMTHPIIMRDEEIRILRSEVMGTP